MYAQSSLSFKNKFFQLIVYLFRKQVHHNINSMQLLHATSSAINCKSINN
jgi:hypothetical protein